MTCNAVELSSRGVNSPRGSRNSVLMINLFFWFEHMLFSDNGFSRVVSPLLIFKKWGKSHVLEWSLLRNDDMGNMGKSLHVA